MRLVLDAVVKKPSFEALILVVEALEMANWADREITIAPVDVETTIWLSVPVAETTPVLDTLPFV